jgi:hypothetical protein
MQQPVQHVVQAALRDLQATLDSSNGNSSRRAARRSGSWLHACKPSCSSTAAW